MTATRRFSRKSKAKPDKSAASTTSALDKSPPVRALSSGEIKSKSGLQPSPKKESFISKLVRKLVPCVAPNDRAHPVEIEVIDGPIAPSRPPEPLVTSEKQQVTQDDQKDNDREAALHAPTLPPQDPSTVVADMDTHSPTPPKAVQPPPETSGPTGGSSQPPPDIFSPTPVAPSDPSHSMQNNTHVHPGDVTQSTVTESEGGFTDDEAHADSDEVEADEADPMEEDDEDTLIMNGGAGIPMGPVSVTSRDPRQH